MKKSINVIGLVSSYFIIQCLIINSKVFLNAQSGWTEDRRIVFLTGGGWSPRAACCGDTIHLVWYQTYPVYHEVYYKRSTDAGLTWSDDTRLSVEDRTYSVLPQITVVDTTIHAIWYDWGGGGYYGLKYRKSTDGGLSWGSIDSLTPKMGYSSIQSYGDTVYVSGINGSTGDLYFIKSTDSGNNWLPPVSVTHGSDHPVMRLIRNNPEQLTITYGAGIQTYFVRSFDGGETWSDSQMVSNSSYGAQWPAMDTDDDGGIHVCWFDYDNSPYAWTGDIFYRSSKDSGDIWQNIDSLTYAHRAVASDILAERHHLHVVWEDDRNDFDTNFEIYYRMSTNLGQSWEPEVRLTNALYHSYNPTLTCGGGFLHVFWQDRREYGNNGFSAPIYYKRKNLQVSISELDNFSLSSKLMIQAYPNPFNQKLNIEITSFVGGLKFNMLDISGRVVIKEKEIDNKCFNIDTKNLPSGVYFLTVCSSNIKVIKKVVKAGKPNSW